MRIVAAHARLRVCLTASLPFWLPVLWQALAQHPTPLLLLLLLGLLPLLVGLRCLRLRAIPCRPVLLCSTDVLQSDSEASLGMRYNEALACAVMKPSHMLQRAGLNPVLSRRGAIRQPWLCNTTPCQK